MTEIGDGVVYFGMEMRDTTRSGLRKLRKAADLLGLLPRIALIRLLLSSDDSIRLTYMI